MLRSRRRGQGLGKWLRPACPITCCAVLCWVLPSLVPRVRGVAPAKRPGAHWHGTGRPVGSVQRVHGPRRGHCDCGPLLDGCLSAKQLSLARQLRRSSPPFCLLPARVFPFFPPPCCVSTAGGLLMACQGAQEGCKVYAHLCAARPQWPASPDGQQGWCCPLWAPRAALPAHRRHRLAAAGN